MGWLRRPVMLDGLKWWAVMRQHIKNERSRNGISQMDE